MRGGSVFIIALLMASPAQAQLTTDEAKITARRESARSRLHPPSLLQAGLSLGELDEDLFLNLTFRLNLDQDLWGLGLALPLRFRLKDSPPDNAGDYFGSLRREDWDEAQDYLKILRYVVIGRDGDPAWARFGDLAELTMGHGSIVYRYYNGFDVDRWRAGVVTGLEIGPYSAEAVFSDLTRATTEASLVGARFEFKPFEAFGLKFPHSDRIAVGSSLFSDPFAPVTLAITPAEDQNGDGILDPGEDLDGNGVLDPPRAQLSDDKLPLVDQRRSVFIWGIDFAINLYQSDRGLIQPYVDFNKQIHGGQGIGFHAGVLWEYISPQLADVKKILVLRARTEYRRMSGDYLSPYFSTTHEIERFEAPPGSGRTKVQLLRDQRRAAGEHGLFLSALAGIPGVLYAGAEYLDRGAADGTFALSMQLPRELLTFVELNAFYYRTGIRSGDDLFQIDDRSTLMLNLRVPLYWIFGVQGTWNRGWRADPGGGYRAVDDWSVGAALQIQLDSGADLAELEK